MIDLNPFGCALQANETATEIAARALLVSSAVRKVQDAWHITRQADLAPAKAQLQEVKALPTTSDESASHSKRSAALSSQSLELSFGCVVERSLLRATSKENGARLAEATPIAYYE